MLNPQDHPDAPPEILKAYSKKLVVVSGGSFGSPLILERSGIGAAAVLGKNGVQQIVDLPGVGERYQGMNNIFFLPYPLHYKSSDHQIIAPMCRTTDDADTLDYVFRGDPDEIESASTFERVQVQIVSRTHRRMAFSMVEGWQWTDGFQVGSISRF